MAPRRIRMFLLAHGASAFSMGVHQVLLAWLAISMLHLQAQHLGWVQAAGLLPSLALMLFAGALADKRNAISIMVVAQTLQSACFLLLALLVYFNSLNYVGLMVYAAAVGMTNAFVQPVREKVVGELSDHSFQLKITRASIVQFSLQAIGIVVASLSDHAGLLLVILVQTAVALLAALQLKTLSRVLATEKPEPSAVGSDIDITVEASLSGHIVEVLQKVLRESPIAQLVALVSFNGFMHMGLFIVAIPILARDVYGFSALQYGLLQFCFVSGMLAAYLILMFKPRIDYPGQGALFSLLYTAIVGFALSREPTIIGLYILIVFWGWIAGYSSTHCRLLMQILAAPGMRGRLMSVYQLMLFGMAPLGALSVGYSLSLFSLSDVFRAMSIASTAIFVAFLFSRELWAIKQS